MSPISIRAFRWFTFTGTILTIAAITTMLLTINSPSVDMTFLSQEIKDLEDRANFISALSVAMVAATFILAAGYYVYSDKLNTANKKLLAQFQLDIEKEKTKRGELLMEVAPRAIYDQPEFENGLKQFPDITVYLSCILDQEAQDIGGQLVASFEHVGWKVIQGPSAQFQVPVFPGITIGTRMGPTYGPDDKRYEARDFLVEALNKRHIKAGSMPAVEIGKNALVVNVGPRPNDYFLKEIGGIDIEALIKKYTEAHKQ